MTAFGPDSPENGGGDPPGAGPEQSLVVAMLLSAAGGSLDAFTWLAHGRVFANAQTGNVVLLGIFCASRDWAKATRPVPPIAAFFAGVFVAQALRWVGRRGGAWRTAHLALCVEIAVLLAVALLPTRFPDLPIVVGVAFTTALQSSSFSSVEGRPYSSVMTTGNLRHSAEALVAAATRERQQAAFREARMFALICATFAAGAAMGGAVTPALHNAAVIVPVGLCLAALLLCLRVRGAG